MMVDKVIGIRKITLNSYVPLLKKSFDEKTYNELIKIFTEYLPCSTCKQLLPTQNFAVSKVNVSRMGRFTVCRQCQSSNYKNFKERY